MKRTVLLTLSAWLVMILWLFGVSHAGIPWDPSEIDPDNPEYQAYLETHDLNGDGEANRYDICWWQWELPFANANTIIRWNTERDFNGDGHYSKMDILAFANQLRYITERIADDGGTEVVLVRGVVPGDASGDGRITERDAQIIAAAAPEGNERADWLSGDWNSDGLYNGEDDGLAWWFEDWDTAVPLTNE